MPSLKGGRGEKDEAQRAKSISKYREKLRASDESA
jgi:hypothetical protein